jgi:hypothetical protein
MKNPTDKQIENVLGGILGDGFNRCLGALINAGAIDTTKLNKYYTGMGSKYYDLVSEQIEISAKYGRQGIRRLFANDNEDANRST